ncbi:unnamed protein product [Prunus armeniaca]|uniref:Uncharacterized protein n=1 Tax=Prunus armeniaca TaxID=36596 RepID=A0A6J5TZD3_PRUAR|nr:unnamed protein product [Prunus armeniaca]
MQRSHAFQQPHQATSAISAITSQYTQRLWVMCRSNEDSQDGSFQKSKCLHETSLLATLPELCIQTLEKLLNTLAEWQESCRNRELAKSAQIMTDSPSLTCRRKRDNQVSPAEGRGTTKSHQGLTVASSRNQWKTRPLLRTKPCRSCGAKAEISEPVLPFCFQSPLLNDSCKTKGVSRDIRNCQNFAFQRTQLKARPVAWRSLPNGKDGASPYKVNNFHSQTHVFVLASRSQVYRSLKSTNGGCGMMQQLKHRRRLLAE